MPWAKLAIVNFVDHASCKASTLNKSKSSRCQRGLCRLHWVCVDFIRLMNTWIIWKLDTFRFDMSHFKLTVHVFSDSFPSIALKIPSNSLAWHMISALLC